jgi:hypothetical protein
VGWKGRGGFIQVNAVLTKRKKYMVIKESVLMTNVKFFPVVEIMSSVK